MPFLLVLHSVEKLPNKVIDLCLLPGSNGVLNPLMSYVMYKLGVGSEHHTALEDKVHDIV
jgi:hypothetical protein